MMLPYQFSGKIWLVLLTMLVLQFTGSAQPAHAACDVKAEQKGLRDRILALHAPTRTKRMQVNEKWRHWVGQIIAKRKLKGKARADYIGQLEIRTAKATYARAVADGREKLMDQVLDKIFSISDLTKLPPAKACSHISVLERDIAALIRQVDRQIEADWATSLAILQAELAKTL